MRHLHDDVSGYKTSSCFRRSTDCTSRMLPLSISSLRLEIFAGSSSLKSTYSQLIILSTIFLGNGGISWPSKISVAGLVAVARRGRLPFPLLSTSASLRSWDMAGKLVLLSPMGLLHQKHQPLEISWLLATQVVLCPEWFLGMYNSDNAASCAFECVFPCLINPLTTNDTIWHRLTLATCYQLAQSILKIGFALAKRWDRGRWASFSMGCRACGSCLGCL